MWGFNMKDFLKIVLLSVVWPMTTYGAYFHGPTKIKSVQNLDSGIAVIEFENLDRGNFGTLPPNVTKMKFDYLKWPKDSRNNSWLEKLMFWKEKPEYKKEEFDQCINWMLENHKKGLSFQFGQTGGGTFEVSDDAVIVPYLHFNKTDDGKEQVCLIDLG